MPNTGSSLIARRDLNVCASHFDCERVVSRGGKCPTAPLSLFHGIAKSCLKQSQPKRRITSLKSSAARKKQDIKRQMQENCMHDFETFLQQQGWRNSMGLGGFRPLTFKSVGAFGIVAPPLFKSVKLLFCIIILCFILF